MINSGGVYLLWLMDANGINLARDITQPISMRTYEVLNGGWSEYRDLQTEDFLMGLDIEKITTIDFTQNVPELMYFKFDSAGNQHNYASSPVGTNPVTISGLTIGSTGLSGTALVGTGASSTSNVINTGWSAGFTGSWTIAFWTSSIPSSSTLYYIWGDPGAGSFRCFTNGVAGANNWMVRGGGLPDLTVIGAATSAPNMIHIVRDFSAGTYKAYKNGVLINTVNTAAAFSTTGTGFTIGGYSSSASLSGNMDEFRMYNRALTANEIAATWNISLPFQAPLDLDAGITAINSPTAPFIPGMHNVAATLKNFGTTTTLTSANIGWSVNGITQSPYSWTGSLSPSATANSISLGSYYFPFGNNTVKVWSYLPNGTTDSLPNNDTITSTNNFAFNNSPQSNNNCGNFQLQFLHDSLDLTSSAGCETDGSFFYVTRWNDTTIWKLNMNGIVVDSFGIPGVSGLRDLAYDGTYFYGGNSGNAIYKMNFNSNPPALVSTINCSAVTVRHISYDPTADNNNGAFWVGNWATDFFLVSRTGTVLDTILATNHGGTSIYGTAYDNITSGGPYLWTINADGNVPIEIKQIKISTGLPTGVSHNCENDICVPGDLGAGLWIHPNIVTGTTTLGGLIQGKAIFGYKIAPQDSFDVKLFNVNRNLLNNNSLQISAAISNMGVAFPNSLTMNYSVNNGVVTSEAVTNPSFINNEYVMTFQQTYSLQSLGNNSIKVWISNVNGNNADLIHCNDTMTTIYYHTTIVNPNASKYYVDSASTCTSNCGGTSWALANNNLQNVLKVANAGDTIFVAKGTYFPDEGDSITNNDINARFFIPDSVVLMGGYPTGGGNRNWNIYKTILSGEIQNDNLRSNNSSSVIGIGDATEKTIIDGFIITQSNYAALWNYSIVNNGYSNPTIRNCEFLNNGNTSNGSAINGGGNQGTTRSPTIENCRFINNQSNNGGAINNWANDNNENVSPKIINCYFENNYASSDGGAIKNHAESGAICNPSIVNCVFVNNNAYRGGAISNSANTATCNPIISNCTFAKNWVSGYGGAMWNGQNNATCAPVVKNCIFWGDTVKYSSNPSFEIYNDVYLSYSPNPVFTDCLIKGCGGSGSQWDTSIGVDGGYNKDFDPLFVDAANSDLRLQVCSKAIDAGYNLHIPYGITVDLDNNPRIYNNGTVDLGAYEAQNAVGYVTINSVSVLQNVSCSSYGQAQVSYYSPSASIAVLWDNGENTNIADSLASPAHKVYVSNTVSGCIDSAVVNLPFIYLMGKIYVDSIANGNNNGCSWTNAFNKLQDALSVASAGDTIFVAKGTYYPDEGFGFTNDSIGLTFNIPDSVVIMGGYPGGGGTRDWDLNKTILSGEIQQDNIDSNNTYNILTTLNVSQFTTIDGLIITKAYSNTQVGGGLLNYSVTINKSSNPTFRNCTFHENKAYYGGAIYNQGTNGGEASPSIINCKFISNSTLVGGYGGAIRNNGKVNSVIYNCIFDGNTALNNGGGGAIANSGNGADCNPVITNCRFSNNTAQWAAAIFNSGNASANSNPEITNCLFSNNIAISGGGVFYNQAYNSGSCNPKLTNCTFTKNIAQFGVIMFNDGDELNGDSLCQPITTNCIFWDNISMDNQIINNSFTSVLPLFKNNIIEGSASGTHWDTLVGIDAGNNLDVDPLFIDSVNFHLQACSHAIDAGINDSIPTGIILDLDSNNRKYNNATVDLGAYEYQGAASYVRIDSVKVIQNATCTSFGQGQVYVSPANSSNSISWSNGETTNIADSLINSYNTVYVINTNSSCNDSAKIFIPTNISGNIIYVDSSTTNGTNTGCSWSNAFTNLQDALLNVKAGDSVLVAQGTYYPDETMSTNTDEPNISFVIPDSIIVLGGYPTGGGIRDWNTYHTILSGEIQQDAIDSNNAQVIKTKNVSSLTKLNGFIVTNGYSSYTGGGWFNDGSGANNSSNPTITNCSFINNYAQLGAGIYNDGMNSGNSSPFITNCNFENNTATYGGGAIYNDGDQNGNSNSTIVNCRFVNNSAPKGGSILNDGKHGGYSSVDIINCSFTKNSASTNGGAIYNDALDSTGYCNSTVANCILWNNSIGSSTEIYNDGTGKSTIGYSIIKGSNGSGALWNTQLGVDGGNNLDANPLFVDTLTNDLHLITCPIGSPAINTGSNDSIPSGVTTDLEGNVRIFNSTVDMGAYEALSAPGTVISYQSQNICQGDSFLFDNNYLTTTGTYYDTLFNASSAGCDSVIQLSFTVLPSYYFNESDTICNGDSILWHGAYYLSNGIYYDSLTTTSSCDSIFMFELFVNPTFAISEFDTICSGDTLLWHGLNYSSSGIYYDSLTTINGCDSTIQLNLYIKPGPIATITALGPTTFCDGSNVTLKADSGSFTYSWKKDGIFISNYQSSLVVGQAGTYSVVITDTLDTYGCSTESNTISINVNPTNFNVSYAANPTSFSAPPFFTLFYNQTPSPSNYTWKWLFGDGNSSTLLAPSHTYTSSGVFTVISIATDIITGCSDTLIKPAYITCISPNPCPVVAEIYPQGPATICANDSFLLHSVSHDSTYTYQWLFNGIQINGANDSIFWAKNAGMYKLIVSDTCTNYSSDFVLYKYQDNTPTILANGTILPCSNDSMELYVSGFYNSYLWSTGQTTSSIYVKNSGQYTVEITDINSCSYISTPYVVNTSLLQTPDICIVGIDSATNNNRIIYERQTNALIDSFNIYRESTVANVYQKIGSLPFNASGIFIDQNSNPAQQAYRYKISAVDTCGGETPLSDYHKTIHLTINKGVGSTWNLIWDGYHGFNFGSYNIYRGTDSTNMSYLTQIQSTLSSYSDLSPPNDTVFYQIEVVKLSGCYPDSIYSKANTNYNSSRSNMANTIALIPPDTTGIYETVGNNLGVNIYPNPNKGKFVIHLVSNQKENINIVIYNTIGKIVHIEKNVFFEGDYINNLDLGTMPKGLYFVQLINKEANIVRKVIVQ
ncbi:choice-of-anchor Q domain-containing protein [Bacteroidota bacterium]